jgi:hypothetical protein
VRSTNHGRRPTHGRRAAPPQILALVSVLTALSAAGCTLTDEAATAVVPSPTPATTTLCRHLDRQLPKHVDGLRRVDPTPQSPLTAGWGDPAIILRCGVARPPRMNDPNADADDVNGVNWLQEQNGDGSFRFTTTLRKAYVEVTLPKQRTSHGVNPLIDLASPVKKTIPQGIAD